MIFFDAAKSREAFSITKLIPNLLEQTGKAIKIDSKITLS